MVRPIINVIRDILLSDMELDMRVDILKSFKVVLDDDEIDYIFNSNSFPDMDNLFNILVQCKIITEYSNYLEYVFNTMFDPDR